jgi:hypothetical protein
LVSDLYPHPVAATASSKLNEATKFFAAGTYTNIFLFIGSMQESGSGKPAASYLILFLRLIVQICVV